MDNSRWDHLLSREGAGELRSILMAHAMVGTLEARDVETKYNGIVILEAGIEVEDWVIHVTDRLVRR
jgi:hypothetical protein